MSWVTTKHFAYEFSTRASSSTEEEKTREKKRKEDNVGHSLSFE
jgi:hypothetical protein